MSSSGSKLNSALLEKWKFYLEITQFYKTSWTYKKAQIYLGCIFQRGLLDDQFISYHKCCIFISVI